MPGTGFYFKRNIPAVPPALKAFRLSTLTLNACDA